MDNMYFFGARKSDDGKIYAHTAMPYTDAIAKSTAVIKTCGAFYW